MKKIIMFIALLSTSAYAQTIKTIDVKQLGADSFEITLKSAVIMEPENAQIATAAVGKAACQGKILELGHYQFESSETVGEDAEPPVETTFKFIQKLSCVDGVPKSAAAKNSVPTIAPVDRERLTQHILLLSDAFFADSFRGKYESAYAALSPDM